MPRRHAFTFRPRIERLEDRTVPTTFTVNTTAMDLAADGQVSLLEAIQAANTNAPAGDAPAGTAGLDTIRFTPALNGQTITVPAPGLTVSEDLTITGPGAGREFFERADAEVAWPPDMDLAVAVAARFGLEVL